MSAAVGFALSGYKVTVWEKEPFPCSFASSRNASIFRTYEADPTLSLLAKGSYLRLKEAQSSERPLLDELGLFIDPLEIDYYEEPFIKKNPQASPLKSEKRRLELPAGGAIEGRLIAANGVVDVHNLQAFLVERAKGLGAEFRFEEEVAELEVSEGAVRWFRLGGGEVIEPKGEWTLVNAGGSWAPQIAEKNGLWCAPVRPHKRHLFFITGPEAEMERLKGLPVLWDERRDIYLKPEAGGFLTTHCDQRPAAPDDFAAEDGQKLRFMEALLSVYPFLENFTVSKYWACLRTFALDTLPVVGGDPYVKNLFWVAGWGGRGITISLEMSETIRRLAAGEVDELLNPFSPSRFI